MKNILALIVCFLTTITANAQLSSGIYRLKSTSYDRYMYEDLSNGGIFTTPEVGDEEYHKLWKLTVNGSSVTLQNLFTGHYAQTQSLTSAQFKTGTDAVEFTLSSNGSGWMFNSGSYMHCSASQGYMVVNWWDPNSTASIWTTEEVTLTESEVEEIQAKYADFESRRANSTAYNTALSQFFTDLSCSELTGSAQSMTEDALVAAMEAASLPEALRQVALTVKREWADETDSEVTKRLRVNDYKAYTPAYLWRNKLNATQLTDMNNPTGIFVNSMEEVSVFVGGSIPDGCSLRLVALDGNSRAGYDEGIALQEGYNVAIMGKDNAHLWVMYTYTGQENTRIQEMPTLKIHIEGGKAYGYCDVTGLNDSAANAEYRTMMSHASTVAAANSTAATDINFVVKGNYGLFYFPLDTYQQVWGTTAYSSRNYTTNYNIYKSIHWFDNVLAWEWSLMGFMKRVLNHETDAHENVSGGNDLYPTYCNNLALTLQVDGGNPYSTTGYTAMPGIGGVESSYNAERADFDNWCAGHESGHNNQGLINLPSSTEASNNLFSNVVTYLHGYRLSRGEPVSTTNTDYCNSKQFALRDIGSTHRMYWQLYLYYHEAARKTDFYPTLFESLREDPLELNTGECFTKFYKKVCQAAEEDLTEFFRAWGFFVPFENTVFGDYTSRTLSLTQSQIDAAIAEVKAMGFAENKSIIFIEDRIKPSLRWDAWANGTTDMRPTHSHAIGSCGELGSVDEYADGASATPAAYSSYQIEGNSLTMNGEGGVGFLVYDADGLLQTFQNSRSLSLPAEAIQKGFTVFAVNADGTMVEVKSISEVGSDEDKRAVLENCLEKLKALTETTVEDNNRVGFYKAEAMVQLKELAANAQEILDMEHAAYYSEMITLLNSAMATVEIQGDVYKVGLVSGNYYTLKSHYYDGRYAIITDDDKLTSATSTPGDAGTWLFVSTGNDGEYYIQNKQNGKYISTLGTSTQATAVAESTDDAFKFTLDETETGVFSLNSHAAQGYRFLHCAASQSYTIVGWTGDASASQWEIVLAEESEENAASQELADIISKTEILLGEVCQSYGVEKVDIPLQVTDAGAAYYISTNAQEPIEGPIANLIDGNTTTFFHSSWSANGPDEDHYLLIDMGEVNELGTFSFWFSNRQNASASSWSGMNSPTNIVIEESEDGLIFSEVATLTTADGLPTALGSVSTFTSPMLNASGNTCRYLRLTVTATNTGNVFNNHPFFALGEFELYRHPTVFTPQTAYTGVEPSTVITAIDELNDAKNVLVSGTAEGKTAEAQELQTAYNALLEAIAAGAKEPLRTRLEQLIADTETLLSKVIVGDCNYNSGLESEVVPLQVADAGAAYYISTNAQEPTEGPIANLIDGDTGTFFHTTWSANGPDEDHCLLIDMGETDVLGTFSFWFSNRQHNNSAYSGQNSPTNIIIAGSVDGTDFSEIATLTTADGLPTAMGSVSTFTSPMLGNQNDAYRYLKLSVIATNFNGSSNGHPFFALGEFSLTKVVPRRLDAVKSTVYATVSDLLIILAAYNKDLSTAIINEPDYTNASVYQLTNRLNGLQCAYDALRLAMLGTVDFNDDGKVNIVDIATLIAIMNGTLTETTKISDLNNDGASDSLDVEALRSLILAP